MAFNKSRKRHQPEATEHVQVVTNGSNIRLETAQSPRSSKHQKQKIVVGVAQDISPVGNFLGFLKDHAVVGLIIGFVIGNQVQSLVKQLISSFVDPLTVLVFGANLSNRTFMLHFRGKQALFGWGAMLNAFIIFLLVLIVMYLAVKLLKLEKLEEAKDDKED
jgi:large-conductance mechanosensitive channel